jgi:hypothetical protein
MSDEAMLKEFLNDAAGKSSRVAVLSAMYSALVVLRAILDCNFVLKFTALLNDTATICGNVACVGQNRVTEVCVLFMLGAGKIGINVHVESVIGLRF